MQVALAVTVASAGVVVAQTGRALASVPAGYRADGVMTAAVRLPAADYPTPEAVRLTIDRVLSAVEARPGVSGAAVATRVPLSGGSPGSDVALASDTFAPGVDRQTALRFVTPSYFDVIGTPVVEGRAFTAADRDGSPRVVLINEALARRLGAGRSIVGDAVLFDALDFNPEPRTPWQVVGVVADARDRGPRDDVQPEVYLSMAQGPPGVLDWIGRQLLLVARSDEAGATVGPPLLRDAVRDADPRLALFDVMSLDDRLRDYLSTERLLTWLLLPLGAIGLALTGFGVFALVLHIVTSRRREIGIRLVLGATPARLTAEAIRQGLRLLAAGGALGILGAVAADRALSAVAFGTRATSPGLLAGVLTLVALVTLAAIWVPTRRAVRQDPGVVLRV
ncbi:MAG: ABC transporter permease [Vicinamibacterales bacterium]